MRQVTLSSSKHTRIAMTWWLPQAAEDFDVRSRPPLDAGVLVYQISRHEPACTEGRRPL